MKLTESLFYYPEHGMLDANTYIIKDHIISLWMSVPASFYSILVSDMKKDGIEPADINFIIQYSFAS